MQEVVLTTDSGETAKLIINEKEASFEILVPFGKKDLKITPSARLEDGFLLFTPATVTVPSPDTCVSDVHFEA